MLRAEGSRVFATSIATLLSRALTTVLFLGVSPMMYHHLGPAIYGVLQFTVRLSAFGGITNLGATSYLKIRLQSLRGSQLADAKKQAVGEALAQWLLLLPLLVSVCVILTYVVVQSAPLDGWGICGVVVLLLVIPVQQVCSIPNVALYSEGKGYIGTISSSVCVVVGNLVALWLVVRGGGLLSVAVLLMLSTLASGLLVSRAASRSVNWYGYTWPSSRDVYRSTRASIGPAFASIGYLALQQTEAIMVGLIFGAEQVGVLVISCVLVLMLELTLRSFVSAALPGLSTAIAKNDRERLGALRVEAHRLTIAAVTLSTPMVLFGSEVFVSWWIPNANFAGAAVVSAMLILAFARVIAQFDALLLDQARSYGKKIYLSLAVVGAPIATYIVASKFVMIRDVWYIMPPICVTAYAILLAKMCSKTFCRKLGRSELTIPGLWILLNLFAYHVFSGSWYGFALMQGAALGLVVIFPGLRAAIVALSTRIQILVGDLSGRVRHSS